MNVYFFSAGRHSSELDELEARLRTKLPNLTKISKIEEITKEIGSGDAVNRADRKCIVFPILEDTPGGVDRLINIAEQHRDTLFFILVSDDISANDYKRLVRTGGAEWVSPKGAPEEILDVLSRTRASPANVPRPVAVKPPIVAFVPSGGGVGNATLSIEAGVQLKLNKRTRAQRVCLLDLDFQTSHVCDYLDIEPRLQIQELAANPQRLDAHLFELFVSRHSSGLDVLAAPRRKAGANQLSLEALDVLFAMISQNYDLVLLDLPATWFPWTPHVLSASDLAIVSGICSIPSLRKIIETLEAIRSVEHVPAHIVVLVNRCERGLFGGVARPQHLKTMLGRENIFFVRDDPVTARHSADTGVPIAIANRSARISKDLASVVALVGGLQPARAVTQRSSN